MRAKELKEFLIELPDETEIYAYRRQDKKRIELFWSDRENFGVCGGIRLFKIREAMGVMANLAGEGIVKGGYGFDEH
jgi:hypothetical protein